MAAAEAGSGRFRAGRVVENRVPAAGYREIVLDEPGCCAAARPGQFLHVLCGEGPGGDGLLRYLRRPFSIFRLDRRRGLVSFLFRVVGEGSRWLAGRRPGDELNFLGPLGNGFPLPGDAGAAAGRGADAEAAVRPGGEVGEAVLVGGGVGIPPLCFLARELIDRGLPVRALLGARTAGDLLGEEELGAAGAEVQVATDDGSRGHRGLVTDLLADVLEGVGDVVIFACGPLAMLRAVQGLAARANAVAYLSLEERMACGVGACLGCPAVVPGEETYPSGPPALLPWPGAAERAAAYGRVALAARGEAPVAYWRVCREGPVFPAWGVIL